MKKRLLSIFLSLVIALTAMTGFATTALASTQTFTSGGLTCTLDTDSGVFTVKVKDGGNGRGADYQNKAGSRPSWYTVYRTYIKSVIIEEGVISIGAYWFYNCANLSSVSFSSTVDTIGDDCFRSCTSLTSVVMPEGCSWYYKELFLDCTALKWVKLPYANYTDSYSGKIPDGTFKGCKSLEEVYVGGGHSALDTNAFNGCQSLKGIVWNADRMVSIGTNALSSVPSTCVIYSADNALSSFASSSNLSSASFTGSCSSSTLSYSYDPSNMYLNISGNGNMTSTPWSNMHYFINAVTFNGVDGSMTIANSAFYNCSNTTYWLNIPEQCTSIGTNAFKGTNFNYVTIASPSISMSTSSFGCTDYARFYGYAGSGVYNVIKSGRSSGYNWFFYCFNDNHVNAQSITTAPTCTAQGYDTVTCPDCDADATKCNYTEPLGHNFSRASGSSNGFFIYSCSRCGLSDFPISSVELLACFNDAISHDNDNSPFNQSNYNMAYDVRYDGYVNAKDFLLISRTTKDIDVTNKQTTISTGTQYQTMEGFGASGAWWAQEMGKWTDEQIDVVTELLYGETGAGLDIYRYNLGGGSENDTAIGDWRRRAEDFLSSSSDINDASTYDWNADAAAQKVLASVKRANSDFKLTLFSNSPPVSITTNGKAYCNAHTETTSTSWSGSTTTVTYAENLSSSNYKSFATYLVNCAEHFIDMGYNVTEISPINEPGWSWEGPNASQEGCHYSADGARTFYNDYMIPALKDSSKLNGKVGLAVWECEQLQITSRDNNSEYYAKFLPYMFSSASTYSSKNANIRSYVDSFDTHSYWASESEKITTASDISGNNYKAIQKVRCSEYCQMTNDGNNNTLGYLNSADNGGDGNGLDIYFGLALADTMYQDLTILNAVEWDWWVACTEGVYPDGLVYYQYSNPDNIRTAKRLWVMGNYAKFIDDGAIRVKVDVGSSFGKNLTENKTYGTDKNNYIEQTAYLNPDGSVVVVYINHYNSDEYTTFGTAYDTLDTYVTDATRDLKHFQSGSAKNTAVLIPANSVTTVVLK